MDAFQVNVIVKFGGACVTKKNEYQTLNRGALARAVEAVKGLDRAIIVHGAGSYGHFEAVQYHLKDGIADNNHEEAVKGFCKTRLSVLTLHQEVLKTLIESNVNAFGVSPSGSWEMSDGEVVTSDMTILEDLLQRGFTPVLHGDCVRDRARGFGILSGDGIVETLSKHFKPKRVVFLSNVDGVYSRFPDHPEAELLREIKLSQEGTLDGVESGTSPSDVTGGMAGKLARACNIARLQIPVFVVNSGRDAFLACQEGAIGERGTRIVG